MGAVQAKTSRAEKEREQQIKDGAFALAMIACTHHSRSVVRFVLALQQRDVKEAEANFKTIADDFDNLKAALEQWIKLVEASKK